MSNALTYLWLAFAVALTVLEINTTALVCLWFIIGSVGAFLTSLATTSLSAQLAVFAVTSGVALIITKPLAAKLTHKKPVPTNFDMVIGKQATLTEDITLPSKGRLKLDGLSWLATADQNIAAGRLVRVVAVHGNTLQVEKM